MNPIFFELAAELHQWLLENHEQEEELYVGIYKAKSPYRGVNLDEVMDEMLCFGWAEAIRHSIDEHRYAIRFVPRKEASTWSARNIRRAEELQALGLVHPAGLSALKNRREDTGREYSYENRPHELPEKYAVDFRKAERAWEWFQSQTPSYRRAAIWWVVAAKRETTRQRRLQTLIDCSERAEKIPPMQR